MYERYGDRESLEAVSPAMYDWLRLVHEENPDGIWRHGRGNDYGDWVPAGPDTSHDLFSTCWLYRSTVVGAQVAEVVGDHDASAWLAGRAAVVREAFGNHYVDRQTGRIRDPEVTAADQEAESAERSLAPETQAGYVLALVFDLLDPGLAATAGRHLADMVVRAGRRLQTGFCGSAYLLSALEQAGRAGLAYDLLLRREPPSLGFMVDMGATSVWERWNGLDAAGWPACPTMNSFNHYAMSSMLSWLMEGVCGLRPVPGVPALGRIRFAPAISRRLSRAAFSFEAPAGRLELAWAWDGDARVVGQVRVPTGMTCSIAGTVCVDDDERAAAGSHPPHSSNVPGPERLVGAGDHEVVWRLP
jgi:alpha-L-rhamnosidase